LGAREIIPNVTKEMIDYTLLSRTENAKAPPTKKASNGAAFSNDDAAVGYRPC
jgi:hypothetical protein